MVARRRSQAAVPHHRLQARQERHSGKGLHDRVRPEPLGAHRARHLRRRREALHPAAARPEGRRHRRRRRQRRHPSGQLPAAEEHSARHDAPQRGAEAGQGRPDCAQRRIVGAARRQGRRLRIGEDAVGRDSPHQRSSATRPIGQVGNLDHENVSIGKAGRSRWLGKRPHVRGVAMNPVDHPLGGGEGKTSGGRHPVSPWGLPTKGYKTRNHKRPTSSSSSADRKAAR